MTGSPDQVVLGGRYRLGGVLGRGAMAQVYRAYDLRLGRWVAVKRFRPGGDPVDRRRFETEAQVLAGLTHHGLVAVYDAFQERDTVHLVLQLVHGPTLLQLLGAGPLPPTAVAQLGANLAATLAYVHGRGVVHRDIKPSNILLDEDNHPHLADFGLARLIDSTGFTRSGEVVGTAAYLAPEQVRGERVGAEADVYSLGLVLLQCLTGRQEYDGTPVEAALARLSRPPEIPASVPVALADVLAAMTRLRRAARPKAAACAALLERAANDPGTATGPRTARIRWAAAASGLSLAAVAGLFALLQPSGESSAPATADPASPPTTTTSVGASPTSAVTSAPATVAATTAVPSSAPAPQGGTAEEPAASTKHGKPKKDKGDKKNNDG
ncbi:hypothetical protein GCM10010174_05910 [Kutzneria viridogrisea]|uniref:non-specific serine/threonine protein kinase n=2 Tax=Kutzneria TaxID=43356 RepID=W5WA38_9PSEU|nr:serine/threonine-protein kinase [Kutzneria albida]AHH97998.1 hypothetical protein KALB_4636 [Kutzneria albida DSM 43870]MBA8924345.1 serine/threonine protein kinase [Kutzneria viridogrisea]